MSMCELAIGQLGTVRRRQVAEASDGHSLDRACTYFVGIASIVPIAIARHCDVELLFVAIGRNRIRPLGKANLAADAIAHLMVQHCE